MLCLNSKPADFGIGDLDQNPISKPVDHSSSVLPDPQTTVIQSDPSAKDASADKAGDTPARAQKDVAEEKISAADAAKILVSMPCRNQLVLYFVL